MVDLSTKLRNGIVADLLRAMKVIRKIKEGAFSFAISFIWWCINLEVSLQEGLEDAVFMHAILEEIKGLQKKFVPIDAHVDSKNIVVAMYSNKSIDELTLVL